MWFFGKKKKKETIVEDVKKVEEVEVKEEPVVLEPEPVEAEPIAVEPEQEEPIQEEPVQEEQEDLSEKTVAELKAMAKERGLTGYSTLKKTELISLLKK